MPLEAPVTTAKELWVMPPPFPAHVGAKRGARGAFRAPGRGKGEGMLALATMARPGPARR